MSHPTFPIAIVMQRRLLSNRWQTEKWEALAAEPLNSPVEPGVSLLSEDSNMARWRWTGFSLDLHPSEGQGYYLNLASPSPCVFVMWRLEQTWAKPWVATVSYDEAGRMMDGGEQVDNVPMPAEVLAWVAPWVEANYRPEPRRKKKRNEAFWRE